MSKVLVVLICYSLALAAGTKQERQNEVNQDGKDYSFGRNDPGMLAPLVMYVENANFDAVFNVAPERTTWGVPLYKTKLQDTDAHSNTLPLDEHKFRLCPQPSLTNILDESYPDLDSIQLCLFVTQFEPDEPKQCAQPAMGVTWLHPKTPHSGEPAQSIQDGKFAVMFCYPVVEKDDTTVGYRGGIRDFFADQSPKSKISIKYNHLDLFHFSYNEDENRTEWTVQEVIPMSTPWSFTQPPSDSFYQNGLPMFEESFGSLKSAYDAQDKTKPHWLAHRLAQPTQYPFDMMTAATTEMINTAPLQNKLQPLMYFIEERIQRLSDHISRTLDVVTMPLYYPIDEHTAKLYLDDNGKFLVPNVWGKQIHDRETKSTIVIVVHNYPGYVPPAGLLCKENAVCDFQKWKKESPRFANDHAIDDSLIKFAYCCKEAKFPMFEQLDIMETININFDFKN